MADKTISTNHRFTVRQDGARGAEVCRDDDLVVAWFGCTVSNVRERIITPDQALYNGEVCGAALTAAHEVAPMGYDPVEAFQKFPQLLKAAQRLDVDARLTGLQHDAGWDTWFADLRAALPRAAGKEGDDGR